MSRVGGWRWTKIAKAVLAEDDVCWLCGRPGADSVDHITPVSVDPELEFDPGNLRPAHLVCNKRRGARLVVPGPRVPTSRRW